MILNTRVTPSAHSHLLVAVQLVALALACYPLQPQAAWWPALGLCVFGVLLAGYTLMHNKIGNFGIYPEPLNGANLITTGPYRYVKHPMYSALFCLMLGITIYNAGWSNWFGLAALSVVLACKATLEEQYLRRHFEGYAEYAAGRARFIPGVL